MITGKAVLPTQSPASYMTAACLVWRQTRRIHVGGGGSNEQGFASVRSSYKGAHAQNCHGNKFFSVRGQFLFFYPSLMVSSLTPSEKCLRNFNLKRMSGSKTEPPTLRRWFKYKINLQIISTSHMCLYYSVGCFLFVSLGMLIQRWATHSDPPGLNEKNYLALVS